MPTGNMMVAAAIERRAAKMIFSTATMHATTTVRDAGVLGLGRVRLAAAAARRRSWSPPRRAGDLDRPVQGLHPVAQADQP
jgi:hypothetical protein